jgi:non-heme chloroperoxidase
VEPGSCNGPASPIASRLHFATTAVATGPLLHYAEQGDPCGETLLFIHGRPDSWFSFSRVLPLLPTAYHAYAIDLRGFGDSERPADSYTIDQFATDVVAMDAVGIARATLIGHSMGTFIARRVAQIRPKRVARLAFIGSSITALNDVTLEVQEGMRPLADPLPLEFVREFQASALHIPVRESSSRGS